MPNFRLPYFRSRHSNADKKLIARYETQRRQRMTVNYDFYLFGEEPLMTQVIGLTSPSNNYTCINSGQVKSYQEQNAARTVSPLTVNNEYCKAPAGPAEKPKTSYELDENFLQTINEWQRRNAAALEREEASSDDEESDDEEEYATPAAMSPVKSKVAAPAEHSPGDKLRVGRTLLAIATQKRLAEMAISEEGSRKLSSESQPLFLQRNSIIARTIHRDRTQPKRNLPPLPDTYITSTSPITSPRSSMRQSMISPAPHLSSSTSEFTTPSPLTVSSIQDNRVSAKIRSNGSNEEVVMSPPWAAAMAAIGATSSRPTTRTSKKLIRNSMI